MQRVVADGERGGEDTEHLPKRLQRLIVNIGGTLSSEVYSDLN
jgi:hypothetical protein